jgi:hypothetical protein
MKQATRFASLGLLLTSLAASPALAGDAFGLDLGVHGGVLNSHDGKTGLFVGGAQVRLHLVWLLAAEVRASTYSDSYDVSTFGGVDVKNVPVQVSAMIYLIKLPGFGLHVLGGGTYNSVELEGTGNVPGSVRSNKWAAHAGAGIDFSLGKSFLLNLDGRYVFLDVDPGNLPPPNSGAYKGDYWTATAGILWKIF